MLLSIQQFAGNDSVIRDRQLDVVLIHGTGANGTLWQPQVELLTQNGFRCFVPELRGHGETREPFELTDLDVHIQDLQETLAKTDIKYPAIWVGHSLGAILLMKLAQNKPELFEQILAIGLPGKVPKLVSFLFNLFLCTPFEALRGTFVHKKLSKRQQVLIDTERYSLEQIVENFSHINLVDKEYRISCPIHFAVGRFDVVAPYFYAEKIHKTLPNSTLKIFEFAGHSCMDDQVEQFNQWFLEKITNGSYSNLKSMRVS